MPPRLLWLDTIEEARRRARRGLTVDERFGPGTRSFSEVPFGTPESQAERSDPWREDQEVLIGRFGIRLKGRIDRVDVKPDRRGVRISDYKTGTTPRDLRDVILGGGAEVQRTLYAITIKQLIPEASTIISRLVYLDTMGPPASLEGDALERAEKTLLRLHRHRGRRAQSWGRLPWARCVRGLQPPQDRAARSARPLPGAQG